MMLTATTAAVRPVASTATFDMVLLFRLRVLKGSSRGSGLVFNFFVVSRFPGTCEHAR